jgi:hypothetical protein
MFATFGFDDGVKTEFAQHTLQDDAIQVERGIWVGVVTGRPRFAGILDISLTKQSSTGAFKSRQGQMFDEKARHSL